MQILACPPPAHQGKALTAPAAHPVCPGSQSTSPSGALHQGPGPAWLAPWEGRCPSEPHLLPRKMGPGGPEGYGELQINQPAPSDGRIGPALCLRARARAHTQGEVSWRLWQGPSAPRAARMFLPHRVPALGSPRPRPPQDGLFSGRLPGTSSAGAGLPPVTVHKPHNANPKLRLQGLPCTRGLGRGPHSPRP